MTVEIEKNVPAPTHHCAKYPWAEMQVGDSFLVTNTSAAKLGNAARGWVRHRGLTHKFAARAVDGGVRVWRIK